MRKLIVSMNITLDGFMAGPAGELDWHFRFWNEEMADYGVMQLMQADTILLGRKTYNVMAGYWPLVSCNPCFPRSDIAFADMMNNYQKIVCSSTLQQANWNNSRLIKTNTEKEIIKLKKRPGKNIILYGSGELLFSLQQWDLVDDYILYKHPVVLGEGKLLFNDTQLQPGLELLRNTRFCPGVVAVHYRRQRA